MAFKMKGSPMARNYGAPFKEGVKSKAQKKAEREAALGSKEDMIAEQEREEAKYIHKGVEGYGIDLRDEAGNTRADLNEYFPENSNLQRLSKGSGKAGPNEY